MCKLCRSKMGKSNIAFILLLQVTHFQVKVLFVESKGLNHCDVLGFLMTIRFICTLYVVKIE